MSNAAATAALLLMLTVSCTDGPAEPAAGASTSGSDIAPVVEPGEPESPDTPTAAGVDTDAPGAEIAAIADVIFGDPAHSSRSARDLHEQHEQLLKSCMADAGFDYIALEYGGEGVALSTRADIGDEAFNAQYGYGIVTLAPAEELRSAETGATTIDPNEQLRNQLSASDAEAYDAARWGGNATQGEDGLLGDGGCDTEANRVYTPAILPDEAIFQLEDLEQQIAGNPHVTQANTEWSGCMSDAGLTFTRPGEAVESVRALLDQLNRTASTETLEITDSNGAALTVEVPQYDADLLEQSKQQEILLATTDFACRVSVDYDERVGSATDRLQHEFIAEWIDRIDVDE